MKPFSKTVFRSRLCSSRSWVSRLDFDEVPRVANGLFHIFEANEPQKEWSFPRNHWPGWRPQRSKTEALIQFLLKIKGIGIRCFWPPVWLKTNVHVGSRGFFCITSDSSGISWVHGIGSIRTSSSASSGGTLRFFKLRLLSPNKICNFHWIDYKILQEMHFGHHLPNKKARNFKALFS